MTFTIPSGTFDLYYEVCNELINNNFIGNSCTINYPPRRVSCDNCVTNHFGGHSSNVYKPGGPAPFNFGNCPLCGGNGYHEEVDTDTVRLRIYWQRKDWIKIASVVLPDADVQIIGFLTDLPKVRRAAEIILFDKVSNEQWKFALSGEPFPHGFGKNRYFVAFMSRV